MNKFGRRTWLWLVGILVVVVALGLPALQLLPYFKSYGSHLSLQTASSAAIVRFGLSQADKSSLSALAGKLGLPWSGQDLALPLSSEALSLGRSWPPVEVDLTSQDAAVDFSGSSDKLPLGTPELTGAGEQFMPPESVAVVRVRAIQDRYQLPGKELFGYGEARGTLGVTLTERGLGLIFVDKIKDEAGLKTTLAALKNTPVGTGPGYSGVEAVPSGFSEESLAGVTVEVYNQAGLAYQPTFGTIGGYLVATSSPELWRTVKSNVDQGVSVAGSAHYSEAKQALPAFSVGSIYLDLKALTGQGWDKMQKDLAPLVKIEVGADLKNSGLAASKLDNFFVSWFGVALTKDNFTPSRLVGRLKVSD